MSDRIDVDRALGICKFCMEYKLQEVVKDDFAYDRVVYWFREHLQQIQQALGAEPSKPAEIPEKLLTTDKMKELQDRIKADQN